MEPPWAEQSVWQPPGTTAAWIGVGVGALAGAGIVGAAYALSRPYGYWYPAAYPYQYWSAHSPSYGPVYYVQPLRGPILYYSLY